MTHLSNALREIEDLPDIGIHMPDGCRLSARVWRPVDAQDDPVPAILEFLPYRKRDGTATRDALTHPWFAKRGYACIRVDMRGNGDSEGLMEDEYTQQELDDAVSTIRWLADQPWCTGQVGMMGISWGGFNSLQVAAMQPEALKAIITLCSTADRCADDIHYKGGCLLNENLGWGATMWSYSSRAPDPALRPNWRELWLDRLENEPFLPSVWLRHQTRDAYWQHGSVCEDFGAIRAATLAVGGWGDAYKNTVPLLVEQLDAPAKGIMGPWVHKYPHFAIPEPRIGFLQEALRWWDHWLKGADTGVDQDPDYRAYLMDGVRPQRWYTERPGRWIVEEKGATSHLPVQTLALTKNGLGASGALDARIRSPQNCGMEGGEYCAIWLGPDMPGDQRGDDALSACFDGAVLSDDLDIVGAPRLRLRVSADKPQAQIAVRLNHVHPDGASTRITYGVLNLSHRDSHATPSALTPNVPFEIELDLDHIAYRVPKGHHLRVAISSAYWPLIWPSPEATELHMTNGEIDIPLRPSSGDEWVFEPADSETPRDVDTLRADSNKRRVETDMNTGETHLIIEDDFGLITDKHHGLTHGGTATEKWSIHPEDPLSARGQCVWTQEMRRDDIHLRTVTTCEMWSDINTFYLKAKLIAYEGETEVFSKETEDSIPREQM
ncbi:MULTISPECIES: CocE/NonD family hydrolase [unclassified Ruegeria]|uniref:CocE/NonD family hydrolase n=1 Tax=unclassified Ruegeria TaxID=2625375 RepID=UPI001ADD3B37|nr:MULTISPECIES: CocE/NonD family hydrolase [unclassified Ruegeria]MBO9411164.1 CocE/NonD family hydrolase [Ruegeria sp. R8_1]MBO9415365.1 CocE/NonD family hydrolase [Ruegeria sp. R8_2]